MNEYDKIDFVSGRRGIRSIFFFWRYHLGFFDCPRLAAAARCGILCSTNIYYVRLMLSTVSCNVQATLLHNNACNNGYMSLHFRSVAVFFPCEFLFGNIYGHMLTAITLLLPSTFYFVFSNAACTIDMNGPNPDPGVKEHLHQGLKSAPEEYLGLRIEK